MSRVPALEGGRRVGRWTKYRILDIAFLPQPHATSPCEKWLAVKVCEATAKGGSTLTDRQLFTTLQTGGVAMTKTRRSESSRALAASGGTYRASDNRALRRFCGDNLRVSEKTALTDRAAATPDSAITKALTLVTQVQANHTKSRFWKEITPRNVRRGLC